MPLPLFHMQRIEHRQHHRAHATSCAFTLLSRAKHVNNVVGGTGLCLGSDVPWSYQSLIHRGARTRAAR
jgi:hypothetical protein